LFLIAEGRLAYIGALNAANDFFASQGFTCPSNYNPADYFIKTLAIEPANIEVCQERVRVICDSFATSTFNDDLSHDISSTGQNATQSEFSIGDKSSAYKSGFFTQMYWLIWRSYLSNIRDPMSTNIAFFQTIVT
jgi:hypothetical protein